jgi:2,4-dienoyl-CoA reductase-like NADH-dependent reductase (Old Yellow Enzyme family)
MAMSVPTEERVDLASLFNPLKIGELEIRNRLAVAPMTRISATEIGHPTARMSDYYGGYAEGGFGLVITEGVHTDQAFSQGYLYQPGLSDDAQRDVWKPIVERVHARGARFFAQLMHAGALSVGDPTGRAPNAVLSWIGGVSVASRNDQDGDGRGDCWFLLRRQLGHAKRVLTALRSTAPMVISSICS